MKKRIAVLLFLVTLFAAAGAFALGNRVFDGANLFSAAEEAALQQKIEAFYEANSADLVIVTTNDTSGKSSRDYADDFYDGDGFGANGDHTGALMLINMDERETYISTAGHMIDVLTDERIEAILDLQFTYLPSGDYYTAMDKSIDRISGYMAKGVVEGQYRYDEETGERIYYDEDKINPFSLMWIVASLGAGLLAAFITTAVIRASYKKAFKPVPYDYQANTNLTLTLSNDTFINSTTTKQYVPPSPPPGSSDSSSGRSTTHTSSSGNTHGGGGRKF